jgi:hypothetical protein
MTTTTSVLIGEGGYEGLTILMTGGASAGIASSADERPSSRFVSLTMEPSPPSLPDERPGPALRISGHTLLEHRDEGPSREDGPLAIPRRRSWTSLPSSSTRTSWLISRAITSCSVATRS